MAHCRNGSRSAPSVICGIGVADAGGSYRQGCGKVPILGHLQLPIPTVNTVNLLNHGG